MKNRTMKMNARQLLALYVFAFSCLGAMAYEDKIEALEIVDVDSDSIRCMLRLSYSSQFTMDSLSVQDEASGDCRAELYFKEWLPLLDRWSAENYFYFSLPFARYVLLHLQLYASTVDYDSWTSNWQQWERGEGGVSYYDYRPWYRRDVAMPLSLGTVPVSSSALCDAGEEDIAVSLEGGALHIKGLLAVNSESTPYISYQVFDDSVVISRSGKCYPVYNELACKLVSPPCQAKLYSIDMSIPYCTGHQYDVYVNGINDVPSQHFEVNGTTNNTELPFLDIVFPNSATYYDLQGRRVTQPTHGIYIQNGRKVLVR